MEGIAKAKSKGVYRGRKPSIDEQEVHRLRKSGMGPTAIAKKNAELAALVSTAI